MYLFLAVNASSRWLNNVSGVYLAQVSLLPIDWRIVQILRQSRGKRQKQKLLLAQYKQQANPILSMNNYTPLVISRNDKNKQLTIIKPINNLFVF